MDSTQILIVAALIGVIQLVLLFSIIRTATNTAQTNKLLSEISKKLDK
jgi:hypothetical protein